MQAKDLIFDKSRLWSDLPVKVVNLPARDQIRRAELVIYAKRET